MMGTPSWEEPEPARDTLRRVFEAVGGAVRVHQSTRHVLLLEEEGEPIATYGPVDWEAIFFMVKGEGWTSGSKETPPNPAEWGKVYKPSQGETPLAVTAAVGGQPEWNEPNFGPEGTRGEAEELEDPYAEAPGAPAWAHLTLDDVEVAPGEPPYDMLHPNGQWLNIWALQEDSNQQVVGYYFPHLHHERADNLRGKGKGRSWSDAEIEAYCVNPDDWPKPPERSSVRRPEGKSKGKGQFQPPVGKYSGGKGSQGKPQWSGFRGDHFGSRDGSIGTFLDRFSTDQSSEVSSSKGSKKRPFVHPTMLPPMGEDETPREY
jgi:hypothetical protein